MCDRAAKRSAVGAYATRPNEGLRPKIPQSADGIRIEPAPSEPCAIGPSPAAFVVYRAASAVNALLEHANLRAPLWLDRLLSLVTTWPHMHKVHHSRSPELTDTNYGNLLSIWDRLFGTYTPSHLGTQIVYGLDGFDDPALQTAPALLALPFRSSDRRGGPAAALRPAK